MEGRSWRSPIVKCNASLSSIESIVKSMTSLLAASLADRAGRSRSRAMSAQPPRCQLYLVSPLDVSGDFPARLERALDCRAGRGLPVPREGRRPARGGAPRRTAAGDLPRARRRLHRQRQRRAGQAPRRRRRPPRPARRRRARGARGARARGADRRHLPRQPPPGDRGGRGRGRLRRVRRRSFPARPRRASTGPSSNCSNGGSR